MEAAICHPDRHRAYPRRLLVQHLAQALLLIGATTGAAIPAPLTGCSTSGNVSWLQCGPIDIQMYGNGGASSLTVSDVTASSAAVLSNPLSTGPFVQTLTITGATVLNRSDYPAVYMYSSQRGWNANLQIGAGVQLTSAGPFGAVWLLSDSTDPTTSNTLQVDSAATITSTGASSDGISATSNNGAVAVTNRGTVTSTGGRGLYADGGYASLAPVTVSIANLGTVNSSLAGARAINARGTARIDNQGSVRSTTRQGLIAYSSNGGAEITNRGTVVTEHYGAVVAWGTGGNVAVSNSGSITAQRNANLSTVSPDYHGISASTDGSGTVTVTNAAGGTISAAYDAGISAASSQGAISLQNAGRIDALTGLLADSSTGRVDISNSGTVNASDIGILVHAAGAGSVVNTGLIASAGTAMHVGNGVALDVDNRSGGTLLGALYLGSLANLNNAGALYLKQGSSITAPASTGSAIASTIGGTFRQSSTGVLGIAAASNSSYSTLAVGGAAALAGTLHIDVKPTFSGGTLASVLTATGGVTDNGLQVTDNSLRYAFSAQFRSNGVDLVARDTGMSTIGSAVSSQSTGAAGAASVWDALLASGTRSPELNQALNSILSSNDAGEVNAKVQQTLPLLTGNSLALANHTLGSVNSVIQSRVDAARGLASGDTFIGDRHLWLKPFATHSRQDNRNGVTGYSADTNGLVVGIDSTVTPGTELGLAFAYAKSDVSSNAAIPRQSADVNSYQLLLYGRQAMNAETDLLFQLDAGLLRNNGKRQIDLAGLNATANYDSRTAHVGVGLDRRMQLDERTTFKPSIRLDYTWAEDAAYRETGAGGLNLQVQSRSTDALVLGLEGKITQDIREQLSATVNLGVGYDVYNRDAAITAAYAGAPEAAFVTYGIRQSAWLQRGGVGLVYTLANGSEITGRYDVMSREGFLSQTASVRLRWMF